MLGEQDCVRDRSSFFIFTLVLLHILQYEQCKSRGFIKVQNMAFQSQYKKVGKLESVCEGSESSETLLQDFEPRGSDRGWRNPRKTLPWIMHGNFLAILTFLFISAFTKGEEPDCIKRHKAYCECSHHQP